MSKRFVTYRTEDAAAGLVNVDENGVMKQAEGGSGVSSWNDLTDKPFGEVENRKYSLEPTTVNGTHEYYGPNIFVSDDVYSVFNGTVQVDCDGVQYSCSPKRYEQGGNGDYRVLLGNMDLIPNSSTWASMDSSTPNTEPFALWVSVDYWNNAECGVKVYTSGEHTISIYEVGTSVQTIDPKYIIGTEVTENDNGKFVQVVNGKLQAVAISTAEEETF